MEDTQKSGKIPREGKLGIFQEMTDPPMNKVLSIFYYLGRYQDPQLFPLGYLPRVVGIFLGGRSCPGAGPARFNRG